MGSRGDGPAGGGSGTVRDAKKASRKNEPNPIAEFIKGGGVTGAIIRGVTGGIKKSKQNAMDYEGQAAGVTRQRTPRTNTTGNDRDNSKSDEQPRVASQMDNTNIKSDLNTADKTAPTDVEMTDDEYLLKRKKRGRKSTILSSVIGDTSKPTLSKKVLLGG